MAQGVSTLDTGLSGRGIKKKQIGIKKTNLKTKGEEGRKEGRKKEGSKLLLKNERNASFS